MFASWLFETAKGIGYLFMNPLTYLFIFACLVIGFRRVRRERKQFHISVFDPLLEIRALFYPGIVIGLLLSVFTIGLGLVVSFGAIFWMVLCTLVFLATFQLRWLSSAYVFGLAILAFLFLPQLPIQDQWFQAWVTDLQKTPLIVLGLILAMLLISEGILIWRMASCSATPLILKSKRGKKIGAHEAKRLWMLPVFLVVPGDVLQSSFPWWPLFEFGGQLFGLVLFPFGIGFHQQFKSLLARDGVLIIGKRVFVLGLMVLLLTASAYWFPFMVVIAAGTAIVGREIIAYLHRVRESETVPLFTRKEQGLIILDVIQKSPAAKMALKQGEIITKVNGQAVRTETDFHKALHVNRAFCKLEVVDTNGELRFAQRALYDGEHHELGILFVDDEREWSNQAG
jgi:hypothetical protein